MAIAHAEVLAAVVRVFNDDDATYGQPYDWLVTVRTSETDHTTAEVIGTLTAPTARQRRALGVELLRLGFRYVKWIRKKTDGDREVLIDLSRYEQA